MGDIQPTMRRRLSLTKKQLATKEGRDLLELLLGIVEDGRISDQEVHDLATWLDRAASASTTAGIYFLREEIAGVLSDGVVSDDERRLLVEAVLRVLPPGDREKAKAKISAAAASSRENSASRSLATERQRAYIHDLGGVCPDDATKEDASALIDRLLASRPTVRQRMVLRFWNRLDLNSEGVAGVSRWMDNWYAADIDHLAAWELWKSESGDCGSRSPDGIDRVPIGIGERYLARVKSEGVEHAMAIRRRGCFGNVILLTSGVALIVVGWWFLA